MRRFINHNEYTSSYYLDQVHIPTHSDAEFVFEGTGMEEAIPYNSKDVEIKKAVSEESIFEDKDKIINEIKEKNYGDQKG